MDRPVFFLGDLHLGRRLAISAGDFVKEALDGFGLEPAVLSPAGALAACVELALQEQARALVFAGDLIDDEDDLFEALSLLTPACQQLHEAGVALFCVAGNHDTRALGRLRRLLPTLQLLGEGGRWERRALDADAAPAVDLLGWSFPGRHVREDPSLQPELLACAGQRRPGARLIGVVHGDLDRPDSHYAPLTRSALEGSGADAFLLGHIHKPDALSCEGGQRPVGYLGSVCALDPGEPGVHGPWRYLPRSGQLQQLPLSPLRFEGLTLTLNAESDSAEAILAQCRDAAAAGSDPGSAPGPALAEGTWKLLLLRVTLLGHYEQLKAVEAFVALPAHERSFELDGRPCWIERVVDRSAPALDLERLAREPSPAQELAQLLLALDDPSVSWPALGSAGSGPPLPALPASPSTGTTTAVTQGSAGAATSSRELVETLCQELGLGSLITQWMRPPFSLHDENERSLEAATSPQAQRAWLRSAARAALESLLSHRAGETRS